jgi:hypothetical protein
MPKDTRSWAAALADTYKHPRESATMRIPDVKLSLSDVTVRGKWR